MSDYKFSVNLGGMIDILSNHLYSTPKVFLRELLQNGVDAVSMRKELQQGFSDPQVNVTVRDRESLTFTDNGSGLTEEEIHKFISVIGESSKRGAGGSFIGRFGIGLLSCFIVTDEIILRSRSVKTPDLVHEWHGFSDGSYRVSRIDCEMDIGTEIFIKCCPGHEELFTAGEVLKCLRYYGLAIPYPVFVGSGGGIKLMANAELLENDGTREGMLRAGKAVFGTDTDHLDCFRLESGKGYFSGIAYILPYTVSAAVKNRHRIYLKNMLLTEDGSSLLPEWAFFMQCYINTDILRPTASREDFYKDEALSEAREELTECISDYLEQTALRHPELLQKIVRLHGVALRSVAAENDKLFDIFMPYFDFETSLGGLTGAQLRNYEGSLVYTPDIDIFRQLRPVFAEQGELLINVGYVHEKALVEKLGALDSREVTALDENMVEGMLNDPSDPSAFEKMLKAFSAALEEEGCRVQLKSFSPPQLATLYSISRDGMIKKDIEHSLSESPELFTDMLKAFEEEYKEVSGAVLYLNTENELIKKLSCEESEEKLRTYGLILYVQALISGSFPVGARELNIMNDNLIDLLMY